MPIHAQIDGVGTLEFPDGTSPDVVHATVQKMVMQHNAPKPLSGAATPVPEGLQGTAAPELQPFLSSDAARSEGSGLLKVGAQDVAALGRGLSHVPVIGSPFKDSQKLQDMENYSQAANKDETFGKVVGNAAQALPAVYGGGEFLGGMADELAPALGPAVSKAASALGSVAGAAGKHALKGIGTGATLYGLEKLREFLK